MTRNAQVSCNGIGRPDTANCYPASRPSRYAAWTRRPDGFTLVELLVVVTIIAMLVGLLLPAVINARARARMTQCSNNQHELGVAIQSYENAKRQLPGFANRVQGTTIGWVPVLFPFLGRMDLWEGANGWRQGGNTAPPTYIKQLVCPDDVTMTDVPQLTYIVNCGVYGDPATPGTMTAQGVFRNYSGGSNGAISMSDIQSPTQTVMLSESLPLVPPRRWDTRPNPWPLRADVCRLPLAFLSEYAHPELSGTLIGKSLVSTDGSVTLHAPLPAIHPGVVIVTFCDGHVAEIAEDTACTVYHAAVP